MNATKISYPLYRKYSNNKTFFKVLSQSQFEEIQVLGTKISHQVFTTQILPDRNYISDLIKNDNGHWVMCSENEFEELKRNSKKD